MSALGLVFRTACWTCRERKVKCEKVMPCRNCTAAGLVCSYPPQVRTVNRPKNKSKIRPQTENGLLERVHHLESLLKKQRPDLWHNDASGDVVTDSDNDNESQGGFSEQVRPSSCTDLEHGINRQQDFDDNSATGVEQTPGQLPSAGRPLPLSSQASKGLNQELNKCKICCCEHTSACTHTAKSSSAKFPFQPTSFNPQHQLLSAEHRAICWAKYVTNVDPILKIVHKPTMEGIIVAQDVRYRQYRPPVVALTHSIYLLAIVSMSEAEVSTLLQEDKAELLDSCASHMEQALMAADFLATKDLYTIQAFLLFLYYLKHREDERFESLCAVAVSLATRLGFNRDGAAMGLSRLELESRRRIWWQLLNLVDHPDESGLERFAPGVGSNTALPSNLNDDEFEMHDWQENQDEGRFTEATFCLVQYEIMSTFGHVKLDYEQIINGNMTALTQAEEKLHYSQMTINSKYLQGVDGKPIGKFTIAVATMILAKRRLLVHIIPGRSGNGRPPSTGTYDELFSLGVRVLELWRGLHTDENLQQWGWLSSIYVQWSVITFVVKSLAIRPLDAATRRAWYVIDGILDHCPKRPRNSAKFSAFRSLLANAERNRDIITMGPINMSSELYTVVGEGTRKKESIRHTVNDKEKPKSSVSWRLDYDDMTAQSSEVTPAYQTKVDSGSVFAGLDFNTNDWDVEFGLM